MLAPGVAAPIGPPLRRTLMECPHLLNPDRRGLLPAPFGPSTAYTMPAGTARTIPSSARILPKVLTSPVASRVEPACPARSSALPVGVSGARTTMRV
jgi:hypothetical protein